MTDNPNSDGRNSDGTFASGNALGGCRKGSRHKTTLAIEALLEGEHEALTRKAVAKALEGDMISQELLDILRCPLSPSGTRLRLCDDHLECEKCALRFFIKDGLPVVVVEEPMTHPNGSGA